MTIDVSKPKLLSLFITIYFSLYYSYTVHRVQDGVKQVLPIKIVVLLYIYGV